MEFSIYVHVPYCRVQCPYCTFYTVLRPEHGAAMLPLLRAVRAEWALRVRPRLERGDRARTLYLGGGTPSDLPAAALCRFLADVGAELPGGLAGLDEATVECNPESATPELLDGLRAAGVGRISLGVQALAPRDLAALGRASTLEQNRAALAEVGRRFPTWNADLILGIPGSGPARLRSALQELHGSGAPHLSFYCLELPPARARLLGDPRTERSERRKAELYELASSWVEAHGYEHYEISNAAQPGHRALHNSAYWQGRDYVGLGPGAHSLEEGARSANRPDLGQYLASLAAGEPPPSTREALTEEMRRQERLLLALRLRDGLDLADAELVRRPELVRQLERRGLARLDGGRFRLTARGWLLSDTIVLQLLAA